MAFAVVCKSCQARFLLNEDLLRRRAAGRVVTVRCRGCHATIEVDASNLEAKKAEPEAAALASASPRAGASVEAAKPKPLRAPPSPPRPLHKSTLMGLGVAKPSGTAELIALSPGLLGVNQGRDEETALPAFPEPPPPPLLEEALEVLDASEWEVTSPPGGADDEPRLESVDDFAVELTATIASEAQTTSSHAASLGSPSTASIEDYLANLPRAGADPGAAQLAEPAGTLAALDHQAPEGRAPQITLPLFSLPGAADQGALRPPAGAEAAQPAPLRPSTPGDATRQPLTTAVERSAAALEPKPPGPESQRERRNVVAPATTSVPTVTSDKQRSHLAAPLLLLLAAAAGFLIWQRRASHPEAASAEAPQASTPPITSAEALTASPPAPAAAEPAAPAAPGTASAVDEDLTFETVQPLATRAPTEGGDKQQRARAAREASVVSSSADRAAPAAAPSAQPAETSAPAEAKAPREPSAEPSGPFDRAAAGSALTESAAQASSCRKEGDPSGVASVVVTFAPSGRVTSANVSGPPFAGTATGGCIAATLRKARVPAFEGERVTVSKTVVIQ